MCANSTTKQSARIANVVGNVVRTCEVLHCGRIFARSVLYKGVMSEISNPQVSNQPTQPQVNQPEFGQLKQPEYGQMAAAYPGYNPYIYGEPEQSASDQHAQQDAQRDDTRQSARHALRFGASAQHSARSQSAAEQNRTSGRNSARGSRSSIADKLPFDPDDPQENPMYGSWDAAAIIAFASALFAIPIVPLILGAIAIYRDKILHMRGRGLAIAAIIISLIYSALAVYFAVSGIDPMTWVLHLYGIDPSQLMSGSGGSTAV